MLVDLSESALLTPALANFHVQALDLLIESGKRNVELFCRVRLIPVAALQLFYDDAALDIFKNIE